MPKIVPKSMQSQSSQNIKSNQHRNENTESEVMFAALFGGASGVASTEEFINWQGVDDEFDVSRFW